MIEMLENSHVFFMFEEDFCSSGKFRKFSGWKLIEVLLRFEKNESKEDRQDFNETS
jgi:hypothetical protein